MMRRGVGLSASCVGNSKSFVITPLLAPWSILEELVGGAVSKVSEAQSMSCGAGWRSRAMLASVDVRALPDCDLQTPVEAPAYAVRGERGRPKPSPTTRTSIDLGRSRASARFMSRE